MDSVALGAEKPSHPHNLLIWTVWISFVADIIVLVLQRMDGENVFCFYSDAVRSHFL